MGQNPRFYASPRLEHFSWRATIHAKSLDEHMASFSVLLSIIKNGNDLRLTRAATGASGSGAGRRGDKVRRQADRYDATSGSNHPSFWNWVPQYRSLTTLIRKARCIC